MNGGLGLLCMVPLWRYGPTVHPWMLGIGALVLLPYRQILGARIRRLSRKGAARIARAWGTPVERDSTRGRVTVRRAPSGDLRAAWIGNVLTHVRSLHPAVRTRQTYHMWATVILLPEPPCFRCSIMRGWSSPKYHALEWRENTVLQGEMMGLSMGNTLAEGGRETGGGGPMEDHAPAGNERFAALYNVVTDDPEAFDAVFSGALLEQFLETATRTLQYELNVTPTSVNIYTTLAGPSVQAANLAFLEDVAEVVGAG